MNHFCLKGLLNTLTNLAVFANMYKPWKVKFLQLRGGKKSSYTGGKKGRHSVGVIQLASQHMVVFTARLVSRALGLGFSMSFTESVPWQATPCVTAVGRLLHWRHKPLRNNVWSSLLTEEHVNTSCFKMLFPGLKHIVIQNWCYSARNSCLSSNRGLTFPPVTPSYCWNLPLPSDRNNKREHVGSSSSEASECKHMLNFMVVWFSIQFVNYSISRADMQFSDSASWAITSSRRERDRERGTAIRIHHELTEARWVASLWQWITVLQEKLPDNGIKILNFHGLV